MNIGIIRERTFYDQEASPGHQFSSCLGEVQQIYEKSIDCKNSNSQHFHINCNRQLVKNSTTKCNNTFFLLHFSLFSLNHCADAFCPLIKLFWWHISKEGQWHTNSFHLNRWFLTYMQNSRYWYYHIHNVQ